MCGKLCDPRGLGAHKRHCKGRLPRIEDPDIVRHAMARCVQMSTPETTYTADYVIAGPHFAQPVPDAPTVSPPAPESVYDRSLRLQRLGDMVGTTHWDAFLGPEKRREYVSGFTHGFKHGYEHRIKEEEDEHAKE
jgi:hypothetical protein